MRKVDRDALRRALRMAKASEPGRREQIESMLRDREWEEVATFASYCCQCSALRLRPWQTPPCWVGDERPRVDDHHGEVAAWELRRRLIAAGLSEFEPSPIVALEAAAARKRGDAPPVARLERVHH